MIFSARQEIVYILLFQVSLVTAGNPTYNLTDFSALEVLDNHKSVLTSFGIQTNDEELDLAYIYLISKIHKNPWKHRFTAGSSVTLIKLLTHIKKGRSSEVHVLWNNLLRNGINQMWILKNWKELWEQLKSPNFNLIVSINSFDFSSLYKSIPRQKLKRRLATIICNSFIHRNGNHRFKVLV